MGRTRDVEDFDRGRRGRAPRSRIALYVLAFALTAVSWPHPRVADAVFVVMLLLSLRNAASRLFTITRIEALFYFIMIVMAVWSVVPRSGEHSLTGTLEDQVIAALYFVRGALIYLVLRSWIATSNEFEGFILICLRVACAIIVFGLLEIPLQLTTGYEPLTQEGQGSDRFVGLAINPNYFAHWLVILLGLNLGLLMMRGEARQGGRKALTFSLILITIGCVLAQSRIGWATVAILFGLYLVRSVAVFSRSGRLNKAAATMGIIGLVMLVGGGVFIVSGDERMARVTDAIEGSGAHRYETWPILLDAFESLPLDRKLLGIGGNQIMHFVDLVYWPHNNYLLLLVEYGILGIVIFAALIGVAVAANRHQGRTYAPLGYGLLASLIFAVANDTFIPVHFWVMLALLILGGVISRKEVRRHGFERVGAPAGFAPVRP